MNKVINVLVMMAITSALSLATMGCQSQDEHPSSDHATSDHPSSEHPTSEHPE